MKYRFSLPVLRLWGRKSATFVVLRPRSAHRSVGIEVACICGDDSLLGSILCRGRRIRCLRGGTVRVGAGVGQVLAGLGWWLFHVLIVLLQAFIFMMLTLVYIGQAHSSH